MNIDPNDTNTETTDPMAAMAAGIAAASEAPVEAALGEAAEATEQGAVDAATTVEPVVAEAAATPVPGTPEALAAAQAAEAAAAAEAAKPKPDEATEAEITSLGLKEKSAERFRAMATEVKALAPIKDALAAAGITDIAALPKLVQTAKNGEDLIEMVTTTGSTPQQFGDALNYLTLVNKAAQGDRAAAEQAYEMMSRELAVLAQNLGKEVPGVHDPLAAHPDLLQSIEANTITRQHALEIAQGRIAQVQARQVGDQRQQQEQIQREAQAATGQLAQLDATLRTTDPAYALRRPALSAAVSDIQRRLPPSQWVAATQAEYQRLAMIPVAMPQPAVVVQPKPVVPVGPVRAARAAPPLMPHTDDPYEAMRLGIAAASS